MLTKEKNSWNTVIKSSMKTQISPMTLGMPGRRNLRDISEPISDPSCSACDIGGASNFPGYLMMLA